MAPEANLPVLKRQNLLSKGIIPAGSREDTLRSHRLCSKEVHVLEHSEALEKQEKKRRKSQFGGSIHWDFSRFSPKTPLAPALRTAPPPVGGADEELQAGAAITGP